MLLYDKSNGPSKNIRLLEQCGALAALADGCCALPESTALLEAPMST